MFRNSSGESEAAADPSAPLLAWCVAVLRGLVRTPKFPFLFPGGRGLPHLSDRAPHGSSTRRIRSSTRLRVQIVASGFCRRERGSPSRIVSFYPLGNVFEGYIILTTGVQGTVSFSWIEPIFDSSRCRDVFALGRRLFSTRVAVLGFSST